MRKAVILFGVTLLFGVSLPARAQQPFQDVPQGHWAYQAVMTLQERGVVIGYPDGTFGGKRAMTRYEFAVAIQRLLNDIIDKIKPGSGPGGGLTEEDVRRILEDYAKKSDIPSVPEGPDMSDYVRKGDIANFVTREDLQNIQRLVDEFRDELAALGTDVRNIRRDLDALKARVSAIESRLNQWKMSGEGTVIARGSVFSRLRASQTPAGLPVGTRGGTDLDSRVDLNPNSGSILENSKFLYDLNLGITGKPVRGVQANALFNYGNYLAWAGANRVAPGMGAFGGITAGAPGAFGFPAPANQGNLGSDALNNASAQITPLKLNVQGMVGNLGPFKEIGATVGKFGKQYTPYTLKLVDPDSYTYTPETDNGELLMTGMDFNTHIGKVAINMYAAKHDNATMLGLLAGKQGYGYTIGNLVGGPPMLAGMPYTGVIWDQSAGGRVNFDLGKLRIGGTYLEGGINRANATTFQGISTNRPAGEVQDAKRGQVYGFDLGFDIGSRLAINAEYAASNVLGNSSVTGSREGLLPSDRRHAYDAKISYGLGRLSLAAGYKQVDPFFSAPGYWGAIGRWKNPTNIKGPNVQLGFNFGEKIGLEAQAEFYNSLVVNTTPGGPVTLSTAGGSNGVQHFQVGVKYNLTSTNRVDLGWEQGRYHPRGVGVSIENYYNIGFGHSFNDNTSLKLLYQIVDYAAPSLAASALGSPSYKGGIAVGQVSVKF